MVSLPFSENMASTKTVHECLFCPQTFDSAIAKDDHVLEHFAQETCTECNQHLIRIGSTLYSQHNATTCIRMAVKSEVIDKSCSDNPSAPENVIQHDSDVNMDDEKYTEDDVSTTTAIEMNDPEIKNEPNEKDERRDTFERLYDFEMQVVYSSTSQIQGNISNSERNTHESREFEYDLNECKNSQNQFECNICNMKFKLKNNLNRHMRRDHDPCADKYKCKICHQVFLMESSLPSHKCRGGPVSCDICGKTLSSKSALRTHTNLLHTEQCIEFECHICKMKFKLKGALRKHMIIKHDPDKDKLECKICGQVLLKESSLQTHKCKNKEEPVSCDVCVKVFSSRNNLRRHQIKIHSPDGTIFCDGCARIFDSVEDLNKHTFVCKRHTQEPCDICGKLFKRDSLKRHKVRFHSPPGTIFCNRCFKLFSTIEERDNHKPVCFPGEVDINGRFKCQVCKMKFKTKALLSQHMKETPDPCAEKLGCESSAAQCDICEQVLSSKRSLQLHKTLVHSQQRKEFECQVCKMTFKLERNLCRHMEETHDPCVEKHGCESSAAQCDICGKILSSKSSLQTHKFLLHSQQSHEFKCQVCEMKFKLKYSLKRHVRREHDPFSDKYKCKQCKRVFMKESSIQAHECSGGSVPCDDCGKVLRSVSLQKHKVLFHSSPETIFCYICGRLFSTIEERETHRSICIPGQSERIAMKSRFECNLCKMKFTLKSSLRKHMVIIHDPNVDRLKCKQCKRVFMRESSLQTHQCKSKFNKPSNNSKG